MMTILGTKANTFTLGKDISHFLRGGGREAREGEGRGGGVLQEEEEAAREIKRH